MAYYIKDYKSTLNFVKAEVFFLIYFSYIKNLVNKEMVGKLKMTLEFFGIQFIRGTQNYANNFMTR